MRAAALTPDVVAFLVERLPADALTRANAPPARNTPLHWAALNGHVDVLKTICARITPDAVGTQNGRGMSAMSVAMEALVGSNATRDAVVGYLVDAMRLGDDREAEETDEDVEPDDTPAPAHGEANDTPPAA